MWSIFSRDPAKDFAYVIGEKVPGLEEKSVWSLHQGKKKANGEPVSIFVFDIKASSESQASLAKASFKRIKTLRHPNILTFLDGIETDKVIYIATEPVTPLQTYLENNDSTQRDNQLAISWGLHKVTKGLSFLVNDCNLIHNNICMSSVFVDQAGEWKLAGVDYMYPTSGPDSCPPVKILPLLERYDPPEKSDLKRGIKGENWSSDMWGLGCLIWEVFNGPLPRTNALKAFGKIPKNLVPNYCELVSANPSSRPNPAKFISDCSRQGGFMNNPFVKTMLFLEEIQIKEPSEKSNFFGKLTSALDTFPKQLSRHKILPQLLNAFEFGNCGSMVLAPLFKVGRLLDYDEYQSKIVPCVVKLFSSSDRNTRVKLLQQVDMFVEHLTSQVINEKIFPNITSGFLDTNPVVRESTIKAMLHLAPKLSYKNLNEDLLKHFARLQAKDDQGGIRTNTTVCLGKIASHLNPQMRQRVLCSAFLRALKDPFPPARQAGIIGMGVTQHLFTMSDICQKLMPPLCTMCMDPEIMVRDQAFKNLKSFLERLEKLSENPELLQEMEKDVLSGGSVDNTAAGWAGWAIGGVSTLTSKVYSKATKKTSQTGPQMKGPTPSDTSTISTKTQESTSSSLQPDVDTRNDDDDDDDDNNDDGGWDDEDWGDIDTPAPVSRKSPDRVPSTNIGSKQDDDDDENDNNDGWDDNDDDDWGSIEVSPAKSTTTTKKTDNSIGNSSLSSQTINNSSSVYNKQSSQSNTSTDWNWEDDSMSNFEKNSAVSNKPVKGALKLGGKKKQQSEPDFGWIEEEFAPIEDSSVKPASSYDWGSSAGDSAGGAGGGGSDFFSMVGGNSQGNTKKTGFSSSSSRSSSSRETTPVSNQGQPNKSNRKQDNKSPVIEDDIGGWGDDTGGWEDNTWDELAASKESEAARKKREREEKRLQRQQELAQKREARKGGAMKLGAKKLASD
ncbi:N-terminal kinase-like protein [Mactra antiquata]